MCASTSKTAECRSDSSILSYSGQALCRRISRYGTPSKAPPLSETQFPYSGTRITPSALPKAPETLKWNLAPSDDVNTNSNH